MNTPEKPYDIKKRCFQFSKDLLKFIHAAKYERINYSIFDQLLRSGTSIGANVVEGGVGSSKKDVINFYHIALSQPMKQSIGCVLSGIQCPMIRLN